MAITPTTPTLEELNQADDLVFHILKRRAQAIAKASLIEPDAPLSATDLNVLKELRRSSRDLRARLEMEEAAPSDRILAHNQETKPTGKNAGSTMSA